MSDAGASFEARLIESARDGAGVAAGAMAPDGALTRTVEAGGKRIRAVLVERFGRLTGAPPGPIGDLALAVEFLHAATLVHDDVIDNAETRRGTPALHREHGTEMALLVGDLYVARCGVHLARAGVPRAAAELWRALDTIVRGEIDQRGRRFDLRQGQEDYLATIQRKTSSLVEGQAGRERYPGGHRDPAPDPGAAAVPGPDTGDRRLGARAGRLRGGGAGGTAFGCPGPVPGPRGGALGARVEGPRSLPGRR
jgi:hypothetical protein